MTHRGKGAAAGVARPEVASALNGGAAAQEHQQARLLAASAAAQPAAASRDPAAAAKAAARRAEELAACRSVAELEAELNTVGRQLHQIAQELHQLKSFVPTAGDAGTIELNNLIVPVPVDPAPAKTTSPELTRLKVRGDDWAITFEIICSAERSRTGAALCSGEAQ